MRTSAQTDPRLGLEIDMAEPIDVVVDWKQKDWNWLAMYKKASYDNPEFYRQIYKNYLRWYRDN